MISKTGLLALLVALLLTIPLSVAAVEDEKPLSPAAADKAAKLFEEGCALFEKGEHKKALVKYRASLAIAPKGTGMRVGRSSATARRARPMPRSALRTSGRKFRCP